MTRRRRAWIARVLGQLERTWGLFGLARQTEVEFSPRVTVSLGRTYPERRLIRLRANLADVPATLLREVLTHEFAHVAVFARHGNGARPHGPEWRALVCAAGFTPSTQIAVGRENPSARPRRTRPTYLHTCPVCQAVRRARRAMPRWRCAACRDAGLEGVLVIERVSA